MQLARPGARCTPPAPARGKAAAQGARRGRSARTLHAAPPHCASWDAVCVPFEARGARLCLLAAKHERCCCCKARELQGMRGVVARHERRCCLCMPVLRAMHARRSTWPWLPSQAKCCSPARQGDKGSMGPAFGRYKSIPSSAVSAQCSQSPLCPP